MRSTILIPSFIQICRQFRGQTDRQPLSLSRSSSFLSVFLPPCLSVCQQVQPTAQSRSTDLHSPSIDECRSVGPSRCPVAAAAAHYPPGHCLLHTVHTALPVRGAGIAQSVQRLATGWTVQGSNPGRGEIFRSSVGTATRYGLDGPGIESR